MNLTMNHHRMRVFQKIKKMLEIVQRVRSTTCAGMTKLQYFLSFEYIC